VRVLHPGCSDSILPLQFDGEEIRLDIDPKVQPDIVASMTDMGEIGQFDLVYCSHTLEHLHPADADRALQEFMRVLRPGGAAFIMVPDLEGIQPTHEVLFDSAAGPITGHNLYYGHVSCMENPYMQHHCGFVAETLRAALARAGFTQIVVKRGPLHNLVAGGVKA